VVCTLLACFLRWQIQDYDEISNVEDLDATSKQLNRLNDVGLPAERSFSEVSDHSDAGSHLEVLSCSFLSIFCIWISFGVLKFIS